jgi:molecular chaperone DnaK
MRIKRKMGTDHKVKIDDKEFTPQQISAMILQKIRTDAEAFLGEDVKQAVITVPAYFNDNQRTATKDAGEIAGLEVLRLINEPTAASLAYGLNKAEEQNLLVLDLGGGTFDVTVMEIGDGVFEVGATSGDTKLGGTDMDDQIIEWVLGEFQKEEGIDLSDDRNALQRVRDACERAKIELSSTLSTTINLPFIAQKDDKPRHLETELTRAKLEELVEPVLKRCEAPIRQALNDAKAISDDVGKIILVGGPTRMPVVRERFEKLLGKKAESGVDPMQCVAMGAAIQAGVLAGEVKDLVLLDVTPLSLGLETLGRVTTRLVERNTTIPTKKTQVFTTAADGQTSVEIHVLQGERDMAADNTTLGRFHLIGIPPAPRGIPQIEVSFDIDANGILNVSAKDLGTGKEQQITITASTKLSQVKIDEAVKEAEKFAQEDEKKREAVEARNQADSLIYATEKTIKEMGDKLSDDTKNAVQSAVDDLKKALEGDDIPEIKSKTERLIEESQKIGAEIYQQAQAQQASAQAPPSDDEKREGEDDVVDADYKVVDEE